MAAMRGPRLQVGSAAWVAEERSGALQIAQSEVEEFSFSARNEVDWLNEHMAGIFDENAVNIAETFKTPGKLRGKTPRTARKGNASESRQPLSDVFTSTPNGAASRFTQHLNRIQSPKASLTVTKPIASPGRPRAFHVASEKPTATGGPSQDSGYYGSQDIHSQETRVDNDMFAESFVDTSPQHKTTTIPVKHSPSHTAPAESPEKTFQTAKEDQTTRVLPDASTKSVGPRQIEAGSEHGDARDEIMEDAPAPRHESTSQQKHDAPAAVDSARNTADELNSAEPVDGPSDEARSNSDGSSPIRPVVRKSSLNFASLPAREPLTGGKSLGGRTSRTSHLDLSAKSYYGRQTGGKSLGNHARLEDEDDDEDDDGDDDALQSSAISQSFAQNSDDRVNTFLNHNKTYTQRLQDQINLLGKSKPSRPSKSLHNAAAVHQTAASFQLQETPKSPASKPLEATKTTPGAFPTDEDDEDDWIDAQRPPQTAATEEIQSPRPTLPKSYTADIMEGIHYSGRVSGAEFPAPTQDRLGHSVSPERAQALTAPAMGHGKSASVAALPVVSRQVEEGTLPLTKAASVSNPTLASVAETSRPQTPSKSPARGFRDSPLKQVKNKLSSILKSSKGLLASSAAISAEGKTSMLSPSTTRLGYHPGPSSASLASKSDGKKVSPEGQSGSADENKTLPIARRTRASTEREKEEKRLEKEAKRMEQQEEKLEKAREKEREKARVFSKEQEKMAAMEQEVSTKKTEERIPVKETPKPTRSSPRKIQRAPESTAKAAPQDIEMTDAPTLAPPSVPRSTGQSHIARSKEPARPMKPTREPQLKPKQAPTVIRVKPGSQHSQYHSTSNGSSAAAPETSMAAPSQPTPQVPSKASKATLQNKPSTQSLKAPSSASRPKTLELAAKKKEQEEREALRRREAKAEMEKKRAAAQEEQKRQEHRRQEIERQKQVEREQAAAKAEARQSANRQAMIEKAKQTRAPPPPVRSQPNGPPDYGHLSQGQLEGHPARPQSRMETGSSRSQDEASRPVKSTLSVASKTGVKRTIGNDNNEERNVHAPSKGGQPYQSKDAKRRRTSQDYDELENDQPPNIKGPPVRPSAGFMKELPKKSLYQGGYTQAQSGGNLFKATVTSQHQGQMKAVHPMEMAKISKGAIPFAPNSNPAGPSSHKTPVRPPTAHATKSTAKAHKQSPRFQNGESIELPEIETDDEDSDNDDARGPVAAWVDSPNLRQALMSQETLDPSQIFGPPAPLNMEEVFNKSKERFHKFRARTSSANWSTDRLTDEDVRKDMAARDRIRRDGGWSYDLTRDVR